LFLHRKGVIFFSEKRIILERNPQAPMEKPQALGMSIEVHNFEGENSGFVQSSSGGGGSGGGGGGGGDNSGTFGENRICPLSLSFNPNRRN
jgi:hypothetical protein